MKSSLKTLYTTLTLLLLAQLSFAQISLQAKLMTGASDITGDNFLNELYRPGISYGCGLDLGVTIKNDIKLVTGVEYQRLSAQDILAITDDEGNGIGEGRVRETFNQLNLPVLIQVSLNDNGLYVTAGPTLGYLLSSKTITMGNESKTVSDAPDDTFKTINVFVQGGIGTKLFELGRSAVLGELRYQRGVTNYFTTDDADFMSFQAVNISVKITL